MRKLLRSLVAIVFVVSSIGVATPILSTTPVGACASETLLTFPTWYKGLVNGTCGLKSPDEAGGLQKFTTIVILNIVNIIMQLVAYGAAGFIIYGGFKFILESDSPEGMAKARKTVLNAVIGMIIAIFSVGIVNVIGNTF